MPRDATDGSCDERRFADELRGELGYPVRVVFGRSRSTPVQVRAASARELRQHPGLGRGSVVRLHAMFASAPVEVRNALASWIRSGRRRRRRASLLLGEWIEQALSAEPAGPRARGALEPRGTHHDLGPMALELFAREFVGEFEAARARPGVTWGRRGRSAARESLRLGSFEPSAHVARLHRVLDQPAVPDWFVRYVLFHELLHAALPPEPTAGGRRRAHHGARFRAREERYADYARALEWQAAHIDELLRSARRGRPMRVERGPAPVRGLFRQLELFGRGD